MWRALAVLSILLCSSPTWAQDADQLWTDATEKMAQAQEREAVLLLKQLHRDHPQAALADDALFLAATLLEEKLGDPAQAKSLYQQLTKEFPDSRSALASQRRLESLERALGSDDAGAVPLAAFQDILYRYPHRDQEESLQRARALLKEHPTWSEAYRVRLWIAESSRRLGDLQSAGPLFEEVMKNPAPQPAHLQATLGAADVEILLGHWKGAEALLDALDAREGLTPSEVQAVQELRARMAQGRERARLLTLSQILLASMFLLLLVLTRVHAGSRKAFFEALRSPPVEILYLLPFALLFTFMAATGHQEVGPAVAIISGGGLIVTWVTALALRSAQPLTRARALLCGSAATLATISLCYLALHREQLLDLLQTTLEFGPE
jgi:tetratricopeptide (TPR) repeat protein